MKYLLTLIVCLLPFTVQSQWRYIGRGHLDGGGVVGDIAMGVHGSSLFVTNYEAGVYRYTIKEGWQHGGTGIDYTQGLVTSFASLGPYVFAGMSTGNGPGSGWRSSDNGSNWKLNGGGNVCVSASYVFWAVDGIYRSRDSGDDDTYTKVTEFAPKSFAATGACILAYNASEVQRPTDSGAVWNRITIPSFIDLKAFAVVGPLVFAGDSGVSRSLDSGLTWSRVALQDRYIHALASTPEGYLFAGTDSGVFVSMDTGTSWRWVSEAMGARPGHNPDVRMLAVMDSFLYAYVDAGDWGLPDPNGRYSYTTGRPIREMVDTTLGKVVTAPPQIAERVFVYPNPTSKIITVESADVRILGVDVLNVLGEEILHAEDVGRDARPTQLDLSNFASGTYYLRIETDKGVVVRKVDRE